MKLSREGLFVQQIRARREELPPKVCPLVSTDFAAFKILGNCDGNTANYWATMLDPIHALRDAGRLDCIVCLDVKGDRGSAAATLMGTMSDNLVILHGETSFVFVTSRL